jgi:phage terminase large subunit-like protein
MLGQERISELSDYRLKKMWEESKPERSSDQFDLWQSLRAELPARLFDFCLMLGLNLSEKAHRQICEDFFPRLDPSVSIDEFFQKEDRLLFAPRDSYKSSIASGYDVATVCVYPDVKLAIQSAKADRASDHVEDVKHYFIAQTDQNDSYILSRFLVLFPEHTISQQQRGAYGAFTTPARKKWAKEATCEALSIEESRSGGHWHRGRCDDIVTDGNSGPSSTPEARTNLGKQLLESRVLFQTCLHVGTPYAEGDAWDMLRESLGDDLLYIVVPGWRVKDSAASKTEAQLEETDVDLLFPFDRSGKIKLTYKVLRSAQKSNNASFRTQLLCESPSQKPKQQITEEMVRSHVVSDYFSFESSVRISCWDLGYTAQKYSDFSVGVVGSKDEIRGNVVHDVCKGKYEKHELIHAMVAQAVQFRVQTIFIEDTVGARFLRDDIVESLNKAGLVTTAVDFIPVDSIEGAKDRRYKTVYEHLVADSLWFALGEEESEWIVQELSKYRVGKRNKRDDISDALAHVINQLKKPKADPSDSVASPSEMLLAEKLLKEMVYGYSENPREERNILPAYGSYVEELIEPPPPTHTDDGVPIFANSEQYYSQN